MKKILNRGYKVRIYPSEEQQILINKTFGCVRLVWNYSLMEKEYIYELLKEYPKLLNSHTFKTPAKWKIMFPFLKEVDSQALATTQQELIQTFKNFYNKSHNYPRYKSKKNNRVSYTTHTTNNNIRIEDHTIKLPKLGFVKLKKQRKKLPEGAIIKAATIKRNASGKYFVSLRLEFEQDVKQLDKDSIQSIGLDFSLNSFYIDSEGKKANYPYYLQSSLEKLTKYQRRLSKKVKGSGGYQNQKQNRSKLHEKLVNQRNDFLHKQSRYLVTNYDIITTETLDLKEMTSNKYFSKKVTDISYNKFLSYIKYKCEEEGKVFHQVSKYYPSSKTCSNCGTKKKTLPLSQRVYSCECGNVIDRDVNAAINLAIQGMKSYLINYVEDRTASIAW
jgi:putative transposase